MTRWAVIYNPVAGSYRVRALERIERALREEGIEGLFFPTERRGHATELARRVSGVDTVAVYGGDGSLNEVANGLAGRDLPLAFLPGGTANVMAHELGLPLDPAGAAHLLARGKPRAVRPGTLGSRRFLLMAGFGFDGDTVHRVSSALKDRFGKLAYLTAGLESLFSRTPLLTVQPEAGRPARHGVWVVAARARRYGGGFTIHPRAGLTRDTLGLTVVGRLGVIPFLAANLGLGLPWAGPRTWLDECARIVVESAAPVHVQVDGDYFGRGDRFEVGLSESTLPLCFPP
jgi:YegS/Rv2252/BmrU family lipid kinase